MEKIAILVDGKIPYHSPADYGDTEAKGEAPMSLQAFVSAQLKLPEAARRPGLSFLERLQPGESDTRNGVVITRVGGDVCRTIDVTFDTVTPESAENGDIASRGWKASILLTREDLDDDNPSWVDAACYALRYANCGSLEADSSHGEPRWFTEADGDPDYRTGEETRRSFHPRGFTSEEMLALGAKLRGGRCP